MKPRLVFVDDDESELRDLQPLLSSDYEYLPLHWPNQRPTRMTVGDPPALFVLDMYLPPSDRSVPENIPDAKLNEQRRDAEVIAERQPAVRACSRRPQSYCARPWLASRT